MLPDCYEAKQTGSSDLAITETCQDEQDPGM